MNGWRVIRGGDLGATLAEIRRVVMKASEGRTVLDLVGKVATSLRTPDTPSANPLRVLAATYAELKRRFVYVPDPHGVDLVQTPARTLDRGGGDCDDAAGLVLSVARALGFQTALGVLYMERDGEPYAFHVFGEIFDGENWIALDLSEHADFGEDPMPRFPNTTNRERIGVDTGDVATVGFLSSLVGAVTSALGFGSQKKAARDQRKGLEAQAAATVQAAQEQSDAAVKVAEIGAEAAREALKSRERLTAAQLRLQSHSIISSRAGFKDALAFGREMIPVVAVMFVARMAAPIVEKIVTRKRTTRRRVARKAA